MSRRVRPCRNCRAVLSMDYKGERCPFCLMPMADLVVPVKRKKGRKAKRYNEVEVLTDRAYHMRRKDRAAARKGDGHNDTAAAINFTDSHAGHPLGRGFPMGAALREDGETHREAWMRVLRGDPCSYCDAPTSGTVDHIIPQATGERNLHTWLNYTGACAGCNNSKGSKPLLLWLAERRVLLRAAA